MQSVHIQPSCSGRCQIAPSKAAFVSKPCLSAAVPRVQHAPLTVVGAINRARKEEVVRDLTEKLSNSTLVYGLRYKGVAVKHVEAMRRDLPPGASMYVAKNRLLGVAVKNLDAEGQTKWEALLGQKGENAWIFADEDSIQGSAKAYKKYFNNLKDLQPAPKKGQPLPPAPTEITAIVLDGNIVDKANFKSLESMPTKKDAITKIARLVKAVPTKVAVSVKAVPTKLAFAVKALSDLNEDKTMTVEAAAAAKTD